MNSPLVGPTCRSDTETVSRPGPGWAGLAGCVDGLRPGKLPLLFFSCLILFLSFLLCNLSLNFKSSSAGILNLGILLK
jgi:hypothetical protein